MPITKGPGEDTDLVNKAIDDAVKQLRTAGVRVKVGRVSHAGTGAMRLGRSCWSSCSDA